MLVGSSAPGIQRSAHASHEQGTRRTAKTCFVVGSEAGRPRGGLRQVNRTLFGVYLTKLLAWLLLLMYICNCV